MIITILEVITKNRRQRSFTTETIKSLSMKHSRLNQIISLLELNLISLEISVLNKHAPIKRRSVGANNSNFMTKHLRKEL